MTSRLAFVAGGTVPSDSPCYLTRDADEELFDYLLRGEFCFILTSRQMGKSSLMVRTARRLREAGVRTAILDLTSLGKNLTVDQWYYGLVRQLADQMGRRAEVRAWWEEFADLGPLRRWMSVMEVLFYSGSVGGEAPEPLVIFFDEIDAILGLPFDTDEFFAALRELRNRRVEERALRGLTFCLLGVADPHELIRDPHGTPFDVGRRIELRDFRLEEAGPLVDLLASNGRFDRRNAGRILRRVFDWTGGHPYLTQCLCAAVAGDPGARGPHAVDRHCDRLFLRDGARERDDNLLFVRDRLTRGGDLSLPALLLYHGVVAGRSGPVRRTEPAAEALRLSGVAKAENGRWEVRNRIYARVFDRAWVEEHLPGRELRLRHEAVRRQLRWIVGFSVGFAAVVFGLLILAMSERQRALRAEARAHRSAEERQAALERTEHAFYISRMREASLAAREGDLGRTDAILRSLIPEPGGKDRRDFAWELLWSVTHREERIWTLPHGGAPGLGLTGGGQVLTFEPGSAVCIRDTAGSPPRVVPTDMLSSVEGIAFSPSGSAMLCAGAVGNGRPRLLLYRLPEGTRRDLPIGEPGPAQAMVVRRCGFSDDGTRLYLLRKLSRTSSQLLMWDLLGRLILNVTRPHVVAAAVDAGGRTVVLGERGGRVHFLDSATRRLRESRETGVLELAALDVSADGRILAVTSRTGRVSVFRNGHRAPWKKVEGVVKRLGGLDVSANGRTIAWHEGEARSKAHPRVWIYRTDRGVLSSLDTHASWVNRVSLSPDGERGASTSQDGTLRLWPTLPRPRAEVLFDLGSPATRLFVAGGGRWVVAWGEGRAALYDRLARRVVWSRPLGLVLDVCPDGRRIAVREREGVRVAPLQDPAGGSLRALAGEVTDAIFGPDGEALAIARAGQPLVIIPCSSTGRFERTTQALRGVLGLLRCPRSGEILARMFPDGVSRLSWHGEAVGRVSQGIIPDVVSPDGRVLVQFGQDELRFLDTSTGQRRRQPVTAAFTRDVAFHPAGSVLLSCDAGRSEIQFWDTTLLEPGIQIEGCPTGNCALALTPDGQALVAAGKDGLIRAWHAPRPFPLEQ